MCIGLIAFAGTINASFKTQKKNVLRKQLQYIFTCGLYKMSKQKVDVKRSIDSPNRHDEEKKRDATSNKVLSEGYYLKN